jgi:hypothetical protein
VISKKKNHRLFIGENPIFTKNQPKKKINENQPIPDSGCENATFDGSLDLESHSGTNFSSFLNFRVILSITAQSIFVVEASALACRKGI